MADTPDYSRGEPAPIPNDGPSVHDLVVTDIANNYYFKMSDGQLGTEAKKLFTERREYGYNKYGTYLQAFNGRDAVNDAVDEMLDLLVYMRQRIEEADDILQMERRDIQNMYAQQLRIFLRLLHYRETYQDRKDQSVQN